jgi:hypothetical protein
LDLPPALALRAALGKFRDCPAHCRSSNPTRPEKFAAMKIIDVHLPTTDGRELVLLLA